MKASELKVKVKTTKGIVFRLIGGLFLFYIAMVILAQVTVFS
jgi:hypothetical protein